MSELSPDPRASGSDQDREYRLAQIESIVELLAEVWEPDATRVPDWMTQELTLSQMRLILLLDSRGPTPIGRIAEWLQVGLPAASGIVDRIERHGLVARRHRSDDRRVVECVLTERGEELAAAIVGNRRGVVREALDVLTTDELGELHRLARAIIDRSSRTIDPIDRTP